MNVNFIYVMVMLWWKLFSSYKSVVNVFSKFRRVKWWFIWKGWESIWKLMREYYFVLYFSYVECFDYYYGKYKFV